MRNQGTLCILLSVFCVFTLFVGMREAAAETDYTALRAANAGKMAQRQPFLLTVKPVVIFTFGGLSQQEPLEDVLAVLAERGMRGTFFVTERELQRNADNIERIVAAGQDLGIGLRPEAGADFAAYCAQIERIQTELKIRYGIETNVVRQMSGADEDAINEAVSAMGCILVGQGLNVVQSKHKDAQTAEELMPQLFGRWTTSLNRGEVVYLRTDFYTRTALTAEIFRAILAEKLDNIAYHAPGASNAQMAQESVGSGYTGVSVQDVLSDTSARYTYPVDVNTLPEEIRPYERAEKLTEKTVVKEFLKRYIGAPEVGETDRMLGFSRTEMRQADRTGIVKTVADNTVFFTFDDWGSDDSVNHLLYVLRKHQAHGTFFVITRSIHNNPNLLRAIAAEGQEIGSHTNGHIPMTVQDDKGRQIPVQHPEEYYEDVRSSYEKLAMTVGDMKLPSGRYALTRLLRPPTLAVSRMGATAIFNNGFGYIVNGSGSTEDYSTVSMESLVGILHHLTHEEDGTVKRGAILVMHMSSTSLATSKALDMLLTANDALPDGHPGKFKTGFLGDYLTDDYDQSMKQVPPEKGYKLH